MPKLRILSAAASLLEKPEAASSSALTMEAGVPAGAKTPYQASAEKSPPPACAKVGSCGKRVERLGAATASAVSLPLLI
ncbi:hypothetical protein COAQ111491_03740 [Comamonas aquatilis]